MNDILLHIHRYSDLETRIQLQRIFKHIRFYYPKVKKPLSLKYKPKIIQYSQLWVSKNESSREWKILLFFNTTNLPLYYYILYYSEFKDRAKAFGIMLRGEDEDVYLKHDFFIQK